MADGRGILAEAAARAGSELVHARAVASWTGFSERACRRWLSGRSAAPVEAVSAVLERCPHAAVRRAVADALLVPAGMVAVELEGVGGGDGPMADAAALVRESAEVLGAAERAVRDGSVSEAEAGEIGRELADVVRACGALRAALAAEVSVRRAARVAKRPPRGSVPGRARRATA